LTTTNAKYFLGSFQVYLLLYRTNGESVSTINEKVKTSTALIVTSQETSLYAALKWTSHNKWVLFFTTELKGGYRKEYHRGV
jgi:hypothetical protein